jgi:RNA polymerase sigma-70 factor (ECF subfamily)
LDQLFPLKLEDENDREFMLNLYTKYYPLMRQKAYSIVKNYYYTDDLIQDAIVKLIPKIRLLRSLSSYKLTSYIVHTIKHVCFDFIRKEKRHKRYTFLGMTDDVAGKIPDLIVETEAGYLFKEKFRELEQAMLLLSDRDQNLLFYKYNMYLNDTEIGKLLGIRSGHVRQYISRSRQRLLKTMVKAEEKRCQVKIFR